MELLYINLAGRADRKNSLESNFQANNSRQWTLHRIEAVDKDFVNANRIRGQLRDGEKACFLSHIRAIEMSKQFPGSVMIAEDDIWFGPNSLAMIEGALGLVPQDNWDILFADISITSLHSMIEFLLMRRKFAGGDVFRVLELTSVPFAAATAYIVNPKSRDKLLQLLRQPGVLNRAYDLYLRDLVQSQKLRGFTIFPFATTLSEHAEDSNIQEHRAQLTDSTLNAFRKLVWMDRDANTALAALDQFYAGPNDPETRAFAKIVAAFLSPGLRLK